MIACSLIEVLPMNRVLIVDDDVLELIKETLFIEANSQRTWSQQDDYSAEERKEYAETAEKIDEALQALDQRDQFVGVNNVLTRDDIYGFFYGKDDDKGWWDLREQVYVAAPAFTAEQLDTDLCQLFVDEIAAIDCDDEEDRADEQYAVAAKYFPLFTKAAK